MAKFEDFIDDLVKKEGGYVLTDNKSDRGGLTFAGISQKSNPNWDGWKMIHEGKVPSKEMVWDQYRQNYWTPIRLQDVKNPDVAEMLLSCSVLSGVRTCAKLMQRTCGATVDGLVGPQTLSLINAMNPALFEAVFTLMRIDRYRKICTRDKSQRKWLVGWLNRVFHELES